MYTHVLNTFLFTLFRCFYKFQYIYTQWYSIKPEHSFAYHNSFVPLKEPDEITLQWLERAKDSSTNIWLHLWHAFARIALQLFMTQTDINGFLKRGSMFILSEQQFALLLREGGFDSSRHEGVSTYKYNGDK